MAVNKFEMLSTIFVYWCVNDGDIVEIMIDNKQQLIGVAVMFKTMIEKSMLKVRSFSFWGYKDGQSRMPNKPTTFNILNDVKLIDALINKLEGGK